MWLALWLLGAMAGCGSGDDAAASSEDARVPDEDSGSDDRDSGTPVRDAGDRDAGDRPDAEVSAPGDFEILGVTGPDDDTADLWLTGEPRPTLAWEPSTGALGYEVTVYEEDGTTPKCATQELAGDATTAAFEDCALTEGLQYRASVIATAGAQSTAAGNDGLRFAVEAIVLGPSDATSNPGTRLGLALPNDVVIVGTRLIVADQNNSRVLIWNTLPTASHQAADLVLGQPDFSTTQPDYGGIGPGNFRGSNGVASDGTRLIVADRFNYRILIWNAFPTTNNEPADVVLGQPSFTGNTSNAGGLSASSLTEPWVWLGGGKLFVSDRYNYRVLIWNSIPTVNNAPADVVLGQPDMVSAVINNGGLSASSIWDPGRGWVDGTRLFVPDLANHRVLVWNTIPTSNNAPADLVLGQPNMTTNAPNAGGTVSASGFNGPISVWASGNTIAVADYSNFRVLLWNVPLTGNGQAANVVLGQPDATSSTVNGGSATVTASGLSNPNAVAGDATRLAIVDRFNHRVLLYSPIPTATGSAASIALGQPDLVSNRLNNQGPVTASSFVGPMSMTELGTRFAVADSSNARVLIWDEAPASRSDLPAIVLGQPDLTSFGQFGSTATGQSMCGPFYVHSDGTRLAVGEQCARRVTTWSSLPTTTHQSADLAVGQPDLTSSLDNNGGVSASSLSGRPQPHLDGGRLLVADPNNNRVLIWNSVPTSSGAAANLVLGQPDMTSAVANNGGLSAQSLSQPVYAYTNGGRLFVADSINRRVLIWNAIPTASHAAADVVLGQPDMTSSSASAASARTIGSPRSVHVDPDGRLYVVDVGNHRVLYWNAVPTTSYAPADGVIGQPSFTGDLANNGGLSARTLQSPSTVLAIGDLLYVTDTGNDRLLVLPRP